MEQMSVDIWKLLLTVLFAAIGWFLVNLYNKIEKLKETDTNIAVLSSRVDNIALSMGEHKTEFRLLIDRFGAMEKSMTQLIAYHEQDKENFSFLFEKLDSIISSKHPD